MRDTDIPATKIENWFLSHGRISGWVNKEQIVTSHVYSLLGNLLTTQSGSRYLLSEKTDGDSEWEKLETYIKERFK